MARQRKRSPERKEFINSLLEHYKPNDAREWQNRPLEKKYAIVFMDAVHFHV